MDENNNNEKEFAVSYDKEELKNQAKDTVNQVKESFKNTNFKDEANKTKGFVLKMISAPASTIKEVVSENENYFSNAVMLVVAYMIAKIIQYVVYVGTSSYAEFKLGEAVIRLANPILFVLAVTAATYLFGGNGKKSITTIITAVAISRVPAIISCVCVALETIIYKILSLSIISYAFSAVTSTLSFVGTALLFLAISGVVNPEDGDDKRFRKIAVIMLVAYAIIEVLTVLKIY
jgi:hypothetical protein